MNDFVGKDGWPCEFSESNVGVGLIDAIQNLSNSKNHTKEEIENLAHTIYMSSFFGREEELPRNRPAIRKTSEKELKKLSDLAEKLSVHINSLHRPAVSALYSNGEAIFSILPRLAEIQQCALNSSGDVGEDKSDTGEKVEAAEIALAAGMVFEHIGKRKPTLIRKDGRLKPNDWTKFLTAVYSALAFETDTSQRTAGGRVVSVEAQTVAYLKRVIEKP